MGRPKKELEYQRELQRLKVNDAFYAALRANALINADTVYDQCVKLSIAPESITTSLPGLFKRFRKAGLIGKTGKFALSERHSQAIPWYVSKLFEKTA